MHMHTRTCTHAHAHTHTCTRTHTRTHTHARSPSWLPSSLNSELFSKEKRWDNVLWCHWKVLIVNPRVPEGFQRDSSNAPSTLPPAPPKGSETSAFSQPRWLLPAASQPFHEQRNGLPHCSSHASVYSSFTSRGIPRRTCKCHVNLGAF